VKKLAQALALLLLALVAGGWWLYESRDELLARAIRNYGPEVTGVSVKLGEVHLSPLDGAATLHRLEIGNPAGFKTPHALVVDQFRVQLDAASLTKDVIHIVDVTILQPEVGYEHASGSSNLDVIQHHIEAYVAAHGPAGPSGSFGGANGSQTRKTRVVIDQFNMLGAKAQVSADLLRGKVVTVVVPDIHLRDIGRAAGGVPPAEAAAQIADAIRQRTTQAVVPLHLDGVVGGFKKGASALVDKVKGFFK
jgi:hypothetical protein